MSEIENTIGALERDHPTEEQAQRDHDEANELAAREREADAQREAMEHYMAQAPQTANEKRRIAVVAMLDELEIIHQRIDWLLHETQANQDDALSALGVRQLCQTMAQSQGTITACISLLHGVLSQSKAHSIVRSEAWNRGLPK